MCGITGIANFNSGPQVEEWLLKRMTSQLAHRGPDSEGVHLDAGVGLGFRRLSIIDLSAAGDQPMSNEDGSVWIVFNGEFYGYEQHRSPLEAAGHRFRSRSDAETVLHLYEEHGIGCLDKIDGMFAFALYDARKRELFLVRDRLGIKPLFYWMDDTKLVFGSEIKAILEHPDVRREPDPVALHDYLTFMTVPAPRTMFEGIRKLLPGHYLHLKEGVATERQYWEVPQDIDEGMDEKVMTERVRELLAQAVRSQLVSDVPLGAFLSGGVDSSAVVAMMNAAGTGATRTFAISFPGIGGFDEGPYARKVSGLFHTQHREFSVTPGMAEILPLLVWHFDEPFAVSSAFATYFLARMTRQEVTVALSGDGGDELFAGYPFRYSMDDRYASHARMPRSFWRLAARMAGALPAFGTTSMRESLIKLRMYPRFFTDDADHAFFRTFTFFDEKEKRALYARPDLRDGDIRASIEVLNDHYRRYRESDPVNRRLFADLQTTLVDEMLTKVDRMSMASSLEARVPLLDHRLVEYVSRIPGRMKIRGREGKLPLKKALEGILPHEILHRKKHGFNVPMDTWLRGELREMMLDLLSTDRVRQRGLFRPNVVQRVIDDHLTLKANNGGALYLLMNLELWFQMYMDRTLDARPAVAGKA